MGSIIAADNLELDESPFYCFFACILEILQITQMFSLFATLRKKQNNTKYSKKIKEKVSQMVQVDRLPACHVCMSEQLRKNVKQYQFKQIVGFIKTKFLNYLFQKYNY